MSDLTMLLHDINQRRPMIETYESYYDGEAEVTFVGAALEEEFGDALRHMFVNRVAPVIEATLDRLEVRSFEDIEGTDNDEVANDVWQSAQLSKTARAVHFDALTAGDGWVLVWPDADGLKVMPQEPSDIAVMWQSDNPNVIEVAAKTWQRRDGTWRMNLYYADRLEKYETNGVHPSPPESDGGWIEYREDDVAWPIYHEMGRVPIFHFHVSHKAGKYGTSDIKAIIPLQDRLNMTIANQAIAEEFQSYPQRWATGIQPIRDDQGVVISPFEEGGADRVWLATNEGTRFGSFAAADLAQFETVIEGHEKRIARTARIPLHYIAPSGDAPSGESLKTAEAPFVAKIKGRQATFGDTWADLVSFILSLSDVVVSLKTIWASAETRDAMGELQRALIKQELGVGKQQTLVELSYEVDQIAAWAEEDAELLRANDLRNEGLVA